MSLSGGWCLFGLQARCVVFTDRKESQTSLTVLNGP